MLLSPISCCIVWVFTLACSIINAIMSPTEASILLNTLVMLFYSGGAVAWAGSLCALVSCVVFVYCINPLYWSLVGIPGECECVHCESVHCESVSVCIVRVWVWTVSVCTVRVWVCALWECECVLLSVAILWILLLPMRACKCASVQPRPALYCWCGSSRLYQIQCGACVYMWGLRNKLQLILLSCVSLCRSVVEWGEKGIVWSLWVCDNSTESHLSPCFSVIWRLVPRFRYHISSMTFTECVIIRHYYSSTIQSRPWLNRSTLAGSHW